MIRNDEALDVLRQLIRIDTTNPPGNEEAAAQCIESYLKKEGISSELFLAAPGRANLLARIKGRKPGEPIILLSHTDVVPAQEKGWTEDPFGAAVKNGFVYGRGAVDMKAMLVAQLIAFVSLKREGITPERDILFLATCDEEVGGKLGVEFMLERVEELSDAAFVLSEGGCITEEQGVLHAQVSVAEKKLCQFRIKARGTGGHGSMPHQDNANEKIVRAANRILAQPSPFKPNKIANKYLSGILKGQKICGFTFTTLADALRRRDFRRFIESHVIYNALLRNTVTLTILKGGEKVNVIPNESEASFDARILPDERHEPFLERIQKIAGKEVEVIPIGPGESIPSSYDTHFFKAIRRIVKGHKGNIPVLPFLTTGATDLRHFRSLGITAYGFAPIRFSREELLTMHSVDERISLEHFYEGVNATCEIVSYLATYSPTE